jgi:hypothetical protein
MLSPRQLIRPPRRIAVTSNRLARGLSQVAGLAEQLDIAGIIGTPLPERNHMIEIVGSIRGEKPRQIDLTQDTAAMVSVEDGVSGPYWQWLSFDFSIRTELLTRDGYLMKVNIAGDGEIELQ